MKNKKVIAIIIVALAVISLALGVIGYLQYRKGTNPNNIQYTVTYKYYLNNDEVTEMPTNATLVSSSSEEEMSSSGETEKIYAFNSANCTNKVKYKWNDSKWTFTPENTADSVCSLYFVTTTNELTVTATNAVVTPLLSNKIKRGEDAVLVITPTEGYKYKSTTCTNNEVAEWDATKKELTIKSIYDKTSCAVTYEMSKFSVEAKVTNGSGATKVEYNYGTKVEINLAAASGYGNPTIACTNTQTGTWANGVFTITKLTNDTVCTVDFKQLQTNTTYTVTLDLGSHGILASGTPTVTVVSGSSASFTVTVINSNYLLDTPTCTGGSVSRQGNIITISNVTQNISCTANYIAQ